MRTRFAPSPTGYLHIGHARAAREAFDYAQEHGGTCLVRIEDTDHTRCKPDYRQGLLEDLDWLGFDWPVPMRLQSQHYPDYAKTVMALVERDLAYACLLTRSDIRNGQKPDPDNAPKDFPKARILNTLSEASYLEKPTLPFAIRLNLAKAIESLDKAPLFDEIGPSHKGQYDARDTLSTQQDPIIARKDIGCSYMVAGPHDDALQGITHVVRGEDLFHETAFQVLLQNLMGWETPLYYHHALVRNDLGEKLSKRNLDTTIPSLRDAGQTPEDLWELAQL